MTIDEFKQNIAPYMRHGWVAMGEKTKQWFFTETEPEACKELNAWYVMGTIDLDMFDIEPVDNWKESLIEVGINNKQHSQIGDEKWILE